MSCIVYGDALSSGAANWHFRRVFNLALKVGDALCSVEPESAAGKGDARLEHTAVNKTVKIKIECKASVFDPICNKRHRRA